MEISSAYLAVAIVCWTQPGVFGSDPAGVERASQAQKWMSDYGAGQQRAMHEAKLLLLYFAGEEPGDARRRFEQETLEDETIQEQLANCVFVKLPVDAVGDVDGERLRILDHPSFRHMRGLSGLAIVDYRDENREHYGRVVSCFPFEIPEYSAPNYESIRSVRTILELPTGTLSQRTMVYAVRVHPERPASTGGEQNSILLDEAAKHSLHQASILRQGHHNWEFRFHDIRNRVSSAGLAEVCAESWPGKTLVAACLDCVHSWRQSSGHWSQVSSSQAMYAFDIKLGKDGIWYATGIFAN